MRTVTASVGTDRGRNVSLYSVLGFIDPINEENQGSDWTSAREASLYFSGL